MKVNIKSENIRLTITIIITIWVGFIILDNTPKYACEELNGTAIFENCINNTYSKNTCEWFCVLPNGTKYNWTNMPIPVSLVLA